MSQTSPATKQRKGKGQKGEAPATQRRKPGPPKGQGGAPAMPFDDAVAQYLCEQTAMGRPLTKIVKDDGVPSIPTLYKWMDQRPDFAQHYARAKQAAADSLFEEIMEISDDESLEPHDRRVRIDARKWVAGKLNARKYGDKIIHSGDNDAPIQVEAKASEKLVSLLESIAARQAISDDTSGDIIDVTPEDVRENDAEFSQDDD